METKSGESTEPKKEGEKSPLELERKYLVATLPEDYQNYPHDEIEQGYIELSSEVERRVRKKGNKFFYTEKIGTGAIREESEREITEDEFNNYWPTTQGQRLSKTRYQIPYQDRFTIETDIYHDKLDGLVAAEVEFKNEQEMAQFEPPAWFAEEVTLDAAYKNGSLAAQGLPESYKNREVAKIPVYELDKGINQIVALAKEKLALGAQNIVIEIAGGSASGKTSAVASRVKESFKDEAMVLSMDDYYRGIEFMQKQASQGNILNWDQPEALDLDLLRQHLASLRQGRPIEKPIYSFKTGFREGTETIQPKKVVILEGLFALNDLIKQEGDVRAFVDIGTHGRIIRRLLRDVERTGQKPADILKYFAETVEPMHQAHIDSTKRNADLIINNEYQAQVEADKSGLHEVQMKFETDLSEDEIRKTGAEKLARVKQVDHYYSPKGRNLVQSDEILRIREEGEERILTYKGPKQEGQFRQRAKFEFEIDALTMKSFLGIYGEEIKTISKTRSLFELGGVVFSLDRVSKSENGQSQDLGTFLEIRSTGEIAPEKLSQFLEKLKLDLGQGIKESYSEM